MRMKGEAPVEAVGVSVDDLYRLHAGDALRVARSITRNTDDADDAVAEAFTGVLRALAAGRLDGLDAFGPYLLAATRNASIDIVRRAGRLTPTDAAALDGVATGAGPSDRLLAGEDRALVAEALAGLPPRWRAVLWLTEVEGMAPRDAATLLATTPNNVSQLAVRARGRLRERYVQMHVRNHASGDCLEASERLGGLVAGELTTSQANRVRGHLAECSPCRGRLAELDDLGLSLRRAATPLPFLLHRLRPRWWRQGRGHGSHHGLRARASLATVDPSAPTTVAGLASSPAVQQVAASVAAGLLVVGVGVTVVDRDAAPPPGAPAAQSAPAGSESTLPAPVPASTGADGEDQPAAAVTTTTTIEPPPADPAPFTPRGPLPSAPASIVAHAVVPVLGVYDAPASAAPARGLAHPQPSGAPLVLLVTEQRAGWLHVLLPVRPNGTTGWIRADEVSVLTHDYRILVELGAHRITAYKGTDVLLSEPIGVGRRTTPTPGGLYYLKELLEPIDASGRPDPHGPYGPYAYGLSGYSEVLYDFAGGDGQLGIHGTNDPTGLGRDVSAGCIRMSNAGITYLARTLPLGVPVEVLP